MVLGSSSARCMIYVQQSHSFFQEVAVLALLRFPFLFVRVTSRQITLQDAPISNSQSVPDSRCSDKVPGRR